MGSCRGVPLKVPRHGAAAIGAAHTLSEALTMSIDPQITQRIAEAPMIYWAGRNTGVAEELTLKTNEITRKPADFLEGTYAVHGVEEAMNPHDVVIWIQPLEDQETKFQEVLVAGVGLGSVPRAWVKGSGPMVSSVTRMVRVSPGSGTLSPPSPPKPESSQSVHGVREQSVPMACSRPG